MIILPIHRGFSTTKLKSYWTIVFLRDHSGTHLKPQVICVYDLVYNSFQSLNWREHRALLFRIHNLFISSLNMDRIYQAFLYSLDLNVYLFIIPAYFILCIKFYYLFIICSVWIMSFLSLLILVICIFYFSSSIQVEVLPTLLIFSKCQLLVHGFYIFSLIFYFIIFPLIFIISSILLSLGWICNSFPHFLRKNSGLWDLIFPFSF